MKDLNLDGIKSDLSLSEETNGEEILADDDDDDDIQIISESTLNKTGLIRSCRIVNGKIENSTMEKGKEPDEDRMRGNREEGNRSAEEIFDEVPDTLISVEVARTEKNQDESNMEKFRRRLMKRTGATTEEEVGQAIKNRDDSRDGCESDSEVVVTIALDGDQDSDVECITAVIENNDEDQGCNDNVVSTEQESPVSPGKMITISESDEESPQKIFVRNFAEITERDDSDDDDIVVLGQDSTPSTSTTGFNSSKSKRLNEQDRSSVKTYRALPKNPIKSIADVATFDDTYCSLDMVVHGHADVSYFDPHQHANARRAIMRLSKAYSTTDDISHASGMMQPRPPIVSLQQGYTFSQVPNSLQGTRGIIPVTQIQMRPAQLSANVSRQPVPNANLMGFDTPSNPAAGSNYRLRGSVSSAPPPTMTTVTSTANVPRLSSNIANSNQSLPQLLFDPKNGLLMYPQMIRPTQPGSTMQMQHRVGLPLPVSTVQMQQRGGPPNQTFRLQNGMVLQSTPTSTNSTGPLTSTVRSDMNMMKQSTIVTTPQGLQIQSPLRFTSTIRAPLQANMARTTITPVYPSRSPQVTRQPSTFMRPLVTQPAPGTPLAGPMLRQMAQQQQVNRPSLLPIRPPSPVIVNVPITGRATPPRTSTPPINAQILKAQSANGNKNSMPGITAGNQKPLPGTVEEKEVEAPNKTFPSLVVSVKTCLRGKTNRQLHAKSRGELDAKVKSVLVQSPAKFTEWLLRRGTLKLEHFCSTHKASLGNGAAYQLGMYADANREPFSGGYVWSAECCPDKKLSVFVSSIFEGSKYPPGTVLKLLYHWACQTPTHNILQWVKVSSVFLKNFFTLLRAGCTAYLHEYCPPLGGEFKYVEIGVITLGSSAETARGVKNVNVEILGVFDPTTKIIRMKVINSFQGLFKEKGSRNTASEQGARAFQILWPLTHWVDKRSILLVDGIIDNQLFHELGFTNLHLCGDDPKVSPSNSNIMNYLRHVVPKMFSSTLSVLSKSIVQQFLDELSWRESYGQSVFQCFESMLDHIELLTKWNLPESLNARLNKIYQNPFVDWSYSKQSQRTPLNSIPLSLRNEPGIRECIRHVMKDDHERKTFPAPGTSVEQAIAPLQNVSSTTHIAGSIQTIPVAQIISSIQNVPALQLLKQNAAASQIPSRNVLGGQVPTARNVSAAQLMSARNIPTAASLSATSRSVPPLRTYSPSQATSASIAPTASELYAANLQAKTVALAGSKRPEPQKAPLTKSSFLQYLGRPHTMDVAMYYYGRCIAGKNKIWSQVKFSGSQKCPMCTRTFRSNYDVIRHIATHISPAGRVNETSLCTYCLRELPGNIGMVQHIESAHKLTGCKFGCRICEQRFISNDDLVIHMWSTHNYAEAPYQCEVCDFISSFRQEIIQHFYDAHNGISYVMCPFCLKVLSVETASALKTLVVHMQLHWQRKGKRCSRCLLTFPSDADLRSHMAAHSARKRNPLWKPYCHPNGTVEVVRMSTPPPNDLATEIVVTPPSLVLSTTTGPPPLKKLKLTQEPIIPIPKPPEMNTTLNSTFSVPLNTTAKFGGSKYSMDLSGIASNTIKCIECKQDVTSPNHFIGRLQCTKCRYITACQKAMDDHHEFNHIPGSTQVKPVISTRKVPLMDEPLHCDCGYYSKHPFRLAHHLVICERKTVRPGKKTDLAEFENDSLPLRDPNLADAIGPRDKTINTKATTNNTINTTATKKRHNESENLVSPVNNNNNNNNSYTDIESNLLTSLDSDLSFSSSLDASLSLPPVLSPAEPMPQSPPPLFDHTSSNSSATTSSSVSSSKNAYCSDSNNTSWDPSELWETSVNGVPANIT